MSETVKLIFPVFFFFAVFFYLYFAAQSVKVRHWIRPYSSIGQSRGFLNLRSQFESGWGHIGRLWRPKSKVQSPKLKYKIKSRIKNFSFWIFHFSLFTFNLSEASRGSEMRTNWAHSSIGGALRWHRRGCEFKSRWVHYPTLKLRNSCLRISYFFRILALP